MSSNQNIPKGRSTSRIKNASKSQGFANKDLYGSTVQARTASGTNRQPYRTTNTGQRASQKRSPYTNNSRGYEYKNPAYNKPSRKKVHSNNGEMSESTIVKVIIGSILAAVLLAIVIIIVLVFMDFQL